MKALSIINPWGHLIVYNGKDVENRSRPTSCRGRILIHVSKKLAPQFKELLTSLWYDNLITAGAGREIEEIAPQECGYLIGTAELYGCVNNSESPWAEKGQFHWLLRDQKPLKKMVPVKGTLGLWEYTGDIGGLL